MTRRSFGLALAVERAVTSTFAELELQVCVQIEGALGSVGRPIHLGSFLWGGGCWEFFLSK